MKHSSTKQTSYSSAAFNPERLNRHIKQCHSRAVAIIEIVDQLLNKGEHPISEARQAFRRRQPHQASHMLHSLRGSINNIGAIRVVSIAHDLEKHLDCIKPNHELIEGLFDAINREYVIFLKEAEKWLNHQRSQLTSAAALKLAEDKAKVVQLKYYLESNNLKAHDVFQSLQDRLQSSLSTEDFLHLNSSINQLEFDKALSCIQTL